MYVVGEIFWSSAHSHRHIPGSVVLDFVCLCLHFSSRDPWSDWGFCRGCTSLDVVWLHLHFCLQGILLECGFVEVVLHQPLCCFDCISVFRSCGHTASSYVVMFVFLFTRPAARVWILYKLCCCSTCLVMFVFHFTVLCVSVYCSVCFSLLFCVCFSLLFCVFFSSLFCACFSSLFCVC